MNHEQTELLTPELEEAEDLSAESRQRTSRFFYKYRQAGTENIFDPDRSIRISTRHLHWEGEPIDNTVGIGGANDSEFEITGKLGGGGMGTVYLAKQRSVDREVALKMITPELASDKSYRDSFLREAIVTGNLNHPNIVAVHDLGRSGDGCLFYTMQKVIGISWDRVIRKKSEEENLEILLKLSDAVAYAHSKGVIHRDIKPANVMLGNFGEVMLTDWGVAVSCGNFELSSKAIRLTKESDIEGTPAYMPPEMLDDDIRRIGPRSDIYLLGGILYEIVTGLLPHKITGGDMIHVIRHNLLQPTDQTGELVDIALKAMASDPDARYVDVKEFQAAVRNYQIHRESIRLTESSDRHFETASGDYRAYAAALYGYQEALRLWPENRKADNGLKLLVAAYAEQAFIRGDYDLALSILEHDTRQHPLLVKKIRLARRERERRQRNIKMLYYGLTAAAAALIVILTISCLLVNQARRQAIGAESHALALLGQKEKENYYSTIGLAANNLRLMNARQAAAILAQVPSTLRGVEWQLLQTLATPRLAELKGHSDSVTAALFSPDGQYLLSASRDGQLRIWDARTRRQLGMINFFTPIQKVKCSPDSRSALVLRNDKPPVLVDLAAGTVGDTIPSPSGAIITAADFLPHGSRLLYGLDNGQCGVFDRVRKAVIHTFAAHRGSVTALVAVPDGSEFLTAGSDNRIRRWNADTLAPEIAIPMPVAAVDAPVLSSSARLVAAAGSDNRVRLWNADTGALVTTLGNFAEPVNALAFSRDGQYLLSASGNRLAICDTASAQTVKIFELGPGAVAYAAAFAPDDQTVAVGDGNNLVTLWDVGARLDGKRRPLPAGQLVPLAESSDGIQVFPTANDRLEVRFPDGRCNILAGHQAKVNVAAFLGNTGHLASGSNDTTVRLWDAATGVLLQTWRGHRRYVSALAATDDGRLLASGSWDGQVYVRELPSGREILHFPAHADPITAMSFNHRKDRLLTCSSSGSAAIWDVTTGQKQLTLNGHTAQIDAAVFAPDDTRIVTAAEDQTLRFWDVATGREIIALNPGQLTGMTLDFADRDTRLELHSAQRTVSWELAGK